MRNVTILFSMHHEAGHIISSFNLAKTLQSRGHNIVYLSILDFKELIESQGFKVIIFAEDVLPFASSKPASGFFNGRYYNDSIFRRYLHRITDGTLDKCILSVDPDVLICDPFLSYVAIRASLLNIPSIHLFTSLFTYENTCIPPIISHHSPESCYKTLLSWKWMFIKFLFTKKLKNLITGEHRYPTRMHHLVDAYIHVAKKSGFPLEKNKTYRLNEIGFNLILPEIALCARAFQFAGNIPEQRLYLGDFVDFGRNETQMELNFDDRPIVYCTLGTAASTYPFAKRFYQAVIGASLQKKEWQFILQISDYSELMNLHSTKNLLICKWVPQLYLLSKASVAVIHGGLNSIMECVGYEVPMVIIPGLRDQPGNASRAVHSNIALTTSMKRIEPFALVELISTAMNSNTIKAGLIHMKKMIEEEDGLAECVHFIESYANSINDATR